MTIMFWITFSVVVILVAWNIFFVIGTTEEYNDQLKKNRDTDLAIEDLRRMRRSIHMRAEEQPEKTVRPRPPEPDSEHLRMLESRLEDVEQRLGL